MELSQDQARDIFQWDVNVWKRALPLWNKVLETNTQLKCLEIGGRSGGLSLLAALHGHQATCSDLADPKVIASPLHHKYNVRHLIDYKAMNALMIDENEQFDVVLMKSVLPSIGTGDRPEQQQQSIDQVYKCLKKGGYFLFAENLTASPIHKMARKMFIPWGKGCRYVQKEEMLTFLSKFRNVEYDVVGFLGTFGRTEKQRSLLGKIDKQVDRFLPDSWKYVMVGIAKK